MCVDVPLLELCDRVRDDQLPELGVILEDKEGHTVVKLVGREAALREREVDREVLHTDRHAENSSLVFQSLTYNSS